MKSQYSLNSSRFPRGRKNLLILDIILVFRDRNNPEDDETSLPENLQTWTVIQDNGGFDIFGDDDFAVIKEALEKRFQDLLAISVRESVLVTGV
jgi:hypothetical protein